MSISYELLKKVITQTSADINNAYDGPVLDVQLADKAMNNMKVRMQILLDLMPRLH